VAQWFWNVLSIIATLYAPFENPPANIQTPQEVEQKQTQEECPNGRLYYNDNYSLRAGRDGANFKLSPGACIWARGNIAIDPKRDAVHQE
jgi:hypothetical protein